MAWRILVTDGLAQEGLDLLRDQAAVVESGSLDELSHSDALIVRSRTQVTGKLLEGVGNKLKVIGRAGVGVDNIDLPAAEARGITVVNAPEAATAAVAELTLGLMLALARRIPAADANMREGRWLKKELKGSELSGKTLGILGIGKIGAAVAQRAAAFGMRIIAHDPPLSGTEIRQRGGAPVEFETLLADSDYLCLHLPFSDETRGMIGPAALQAMKPGARLISAARGGIVDEEAVLEALNSGYLDGAALDVFAVEPPADGPLLRHPNVITTPHLGAQTHEAQAQAAIDIATEVLAALADEKLRWRVV